MLALAITLQAVLLLYHQVTTLFDFFPFNGVRGNSRRERLLEAAVNLAFMGFPLVAFIARGQSLMQSGVYADFCTLAGECATWWVPYFFGPSPKWLEIYARAQGTTMIVIPRRGTNPTPNLEHLILMFLTVSAAVAGLLAYRLLYGSFTHLGWACLVGALVFGGVTYQTTLMGRRNIKAPAA